MADQATIYPGYTNAAATAPPVGRPPAYTYDAVERLKALRADFDQLVADEPWDTGGG